MRWKNRLLVLTVLTLLWPAAASAQSPPAPGSAGGSSPAPGSAGGSPINPADTSNNAALQYWQAFVLLPALDKEQEKLIEEWATVPLDEAAQKLIEDSRTSLMYLHRGAKHQQCDWGFDYKDGISLLLPNLTKARTLARLAALRARYHFERGNFGAARDDATAMMALARHVGRDPIMICLLVRYAIENMVIDLVAPYVPDIKAPYSPAKATFDALPASSNIRQVLPTEKEFMAKYIMRELRKVEQAKPGSWRDLWKNMLGAEAPDSIKNVASLDEAVKMVEDLLPVYDELERLAALPRDEFEKQYPPYKEKTKAAQPLAGLLLPSVDKTRATEDRSRARMAMLLAAIAVVESGPDALKNIKDPFGDGPFEYRPLDKGFELKSKLLYDGKPVTLTVGQKQPAKK